ncbi:hypothetical protein LCGC14_0371410 [marine sediment metagenome]|uniref:Uncharacterized protein n=1 Tax=marine sediment metagenome TaxID=412755 RepID=A0A0F9TAW2_9ZZZZ|nr:hypothetical protein [bacterium]
MGKYFIDHIYWALENGYLNLATGVPDPMDGSDVHQGFNVCHGDIEVPKPAKETQVETSSDSLNPDPALSYTKDEAPGSGSFPGGDGMTYRDIFLMAAAFPHKETSGTWGGGVGTYGKILGNFSAEDDRSSIMIQAGITDGSTPINRCYNGILPTGYQLGFKKGGVLKESVELSIATYIANTQAFVTNANFDDGRWSLWALKGATPKLYHATDCKLYWDESHAAELAGLAIEDCQLKVGLPHDVEADSSQLYHEHEWSKKRTFGATVTGIMTGDTEFLEAEKLFAAKTKKDLRLSWDQTVNELKWLQVDDAWVESYGAEKIPHKENARRLELKFIGVAANFEGNYNNLPDPTSRLDLSP